MGVLGRPGAARLVHQGLKALEYRGYDSCGVAWLHGKGIEMSRAVGPVSGLVVPAGQEKVALGHTRWATHGGVTVANAHPHLDCKGEAAVIHNGVLLNHAALRARLESEGHAFRSETDTEVLVHLWEGSRGQPPAARLARLRDDLKGTYSVALLDVAEQAIFFAKHRNPLWVAAADGVGYLASDPVALRRHVGAAIPLEDGDSGVLRAGAVEVFDVHGKAVRRTPHDLKDLDEHAQLAGYEHFMLKEIHETPVALNRLLAQHVRQSSPYVELDLPRGFLDRFGRMLCLGAGTSFHAGLLGAEYMRRLARVPGSARPTPEFKDEPDVPEHGTLVAVLSQSGETLDTLQALHRLGSHPYPTLAFTNNPKSSIGRLADHSLALRSGAEVSVAATKTFLSQSFLLYLLALSKAQADGVLGDAALAGAARRMLALPRAIQRTLAQSPALQALARQLAETENLFLLAKGLHLPAAMEGALKLKEIAYQHAEAYPAGELKHGPFALLTPTTPVLFLLAPGRHESAVRNTMHEVQARGAPTFALVLEGAKDPGLPEGHAVRLPAVEEDLQPFVFTTGLHLLSYWVAKARALPIDKPRNLAKSVTVE